MTGETAPESVKAQSLTATDEKYMKEMVCDILKAKADLAAATQNYEFASDRDMVDLYAYRIIEAQTKYNMLLKQAKRYGISNRDYLKDSIRMIKR